MINNSRPANYSNNGDEMSYCMTIGRFTKRSVLQKEIFPIIKGSENDWEKT